MTREYFTKTVQTRSATAMASPHFRHVLPSDHFPLSKKLKQIGFSPEKLQSIVDLFRYIAVTGKSAERNPVYTEITCNIQPVPHCRCFTETAPVNDESAGTGNHLRNTAQSPAVTVRERMDKIQSNIEGRNFRTEVLCSEFPEPFGTYAAKMPVKFPAVIIRHG